MVLPVNGSAKCNGVCVNLLFVELSISATAL